MDVARDLRKDATGLTAEALDAFLAGYPTLQVGKLLTICMVCFSIARDHEEQWRKYADDGRGVCLGIRVLNEPPPTDSIGALIEVDYSESSWRDKVTKNFQYICSALGRAAVLTKNLSIGLNALHRIAAFASISAKQPRWATEQEFRRVSLLRENDQGRLRERESEGKTIRYLPVSVRTQGNLIALAELTAGPNQNASEASERLKALLAKNGYTPPIPEYPQITASEITPWRNPVVP